MANVSSSNGLEKRPKLRFPGFDEPWKAIHLSDVGEASSGFGFPDAYQGEETSEIPFYKVSDMNLPKNIKVMQQANNYVSQSTVKKLRVRPFFEDAIVFAKVGAAISHERKRIALSPFLIDNNMMAFTPKQKEDLEFIYHLFQKIKLSKYSQVGALPSYNASDILDIRTFYPTSGNERKKIVTILSLVDNRIEKQSEIINNLKKYKRGVFEAIFSRKLRLASKDEQRDWKIFKLSDFASRIIRKNNGTTDIPLTISAQYGLIDQRDFFSKVVASADMSGYYLLRKGEYAYNRSTSNDYPFGSIKRLELYDKGAVSTLYLCFSVNENVMVNDFVKWYFESSQWYRSINEICAEGARNHGLLNVPTDGFFNTTHILPTDTKEQTVIATFLSLIQEKLEISQKGLNKLTELRNGLMQQLFI